MIKTLRLHANLQYGFAPISQRMRVLDLGLLAVIGYAHAGGTSATPASATPCTDTWYQAINHQLITGDGRRHGPDIGSEEWKSVVEFRLGIRGQGGMPDRDSDGPAVTAH